MSKEVEVGIRIDPGTGISFVGIDEVNSLISRGAKVTSILSKSDVLPGGDTTMLAPILLDLLIGCSLMLLAGWAGEALRAGARCGQRNLPFKKQAD